MEVFMSYLRQNAAIDIHKERDPSPEIKRVEDIHAIVRAIARRKRTYRQGEEHRELVVRFDGKGDIIYDKLQASPVKMLESVSRKF